MTVSSHKVSKHKVVCNIVNNYFRATGVYLILTGTIIASHGYVEISDIGSTNDTALICHTDHPATVGNTSSGGNWFSPDGTKVTGDVVPGFMSTRDPMIVRLLRNTATDPPSEGMYICVIKNDTVYQTVYVELYNNKIGTYVDIELCV